MTSLFAPFLEVTHGGSPTVWCLGTFSLPFCRGSNPLLFRQANSAIVCSWNRLNNGLISQLHGNNDRARRSVRVEDARGSWLKVSS